jgi:hypothetical protein
MSVTGTLGTTPHRTDANWHPRQYAGSWIEKKPTTALQVRSPGLVLAGTMFRWGEEPPCYKQSVMNRNKCNAALSIEILSAFLAGPK